MFSNVLARRTAACWGGLSGSSDPAASSSRPLLRDRRSGSVAGRAGGQFGRCGRYC
jgi:hypothetical protein